MGENVKPNPKPDDPEQSKRFEEAARRLEAGENGKVFEKALKIVIPSKVRRPNPATGETPPPNPNNR